MDQHKDYTSLDAKAKGVRRTVIALVALVSLGVSAAAELCAVALG